MMNRIVHQFKKDVAHQRWALIAWVTLLLVHLLLSGFQVLRHVPNPQPSTEQFAGIIASWVLFAPLLFVILLVQSDAPAGTSAFWLTRPLRGPQMLAAKALYIFLIFILLPLAVEMAILFLRGAGAKTWLLLPGFTVSRLPVVLGAFALGAATQRFVQALTLAAMGAGASILALMLGAYLFYGGPGGNTQMPFTHTRGVVGLWSLAVGFAVVVVVQFLTRREGLSCGLFLLSIAGAMIVQMLWPWDFLTRSHRGADQQSDPIRLQVDSTVQLGSIQSGHLQPQPLYMITFPAEIVGAKLAANEFLAPLAGSLELGLTQKPNPAKHQLRSSSLASDERYRAALGSQLPSESTKLLVREGSSLDPKNFIPRLEVVESKFAAWQRDLEAIHAGAEIGRFQFERVGELPLRTGEKWKQQGDALEIVLAEATRTSLQIKLREQVLSMLFDKRIAPGERKTSRLVLVLVNRRTNHAILIPERSPHQYRGASWISPFIRSEETISLSMRNEIGWKFKTEDVQDWLDNGTLVIVRREFLGSTTVHGDVNIEPIQRYARPGAKPNES